MSARRNTTRRNHFRRARRRRFAGRFLPAAVRILMAVAAVLIMSTTFIFGYDMLTQSTFFRAAYVNIDGLSRLTRQTIVEQAGITPEMNIFSLNLGAARKRLLAHPWIADAQITREIPNGIDIRVEEHHALAVVDVGSRLLLNTRGDVFKKWRPSDPQGLPLVKGLLLSDLSLGRQAPSRSLDAILSVLRHARQPGACFPIRDIRVIDVDRDMGITLYLGGHMRSIKMGFTEYPSKYERLKEILHYMTTAGESPPYRSIDIIDPDRVVVHLKEGRSFFTGRKEV